MSSKENSNDNENEVLWDQLTKSAEQSEKLKSEAYYNSTSIVSTQWNSTSSCNAKINS
jgi:hypothetical protein